MNKQGKRTGPEGQLRIKGGALLKRLRNHCGLTQKELADKLKLNYYTMISQIENGSTRVPPNLFVPYARALGVDPIKFTSKLMEYYDPHTYHALFGSTKISFQDLTRETV